MDTDVERGSLRGEMDPGINREGDRKRISGTNAGDKRNNGLIPFGDTYGALHSRRGKIFSDENNSEYGINAVCVWVLS